MKSKVITYQSPAGSQINITPAQQDRLEAAGIWPVDSTGQEYCQVYQGLHVGRPTLSDKDVRLLISQRRALAQH